MMFSLFLYYNISQDSNTTCTSTYIVWIYWIEVIHLCFVKDRHGSFY